MCHRNSTVFSQSLPLGSGVVQTFRAFFCTIYKYSQTCSLNLWSRTSSKLSLLRLQLSAKWDFLHIRPLPRPPYTLLRKMFEPTVSIPCLQHCNFCTHMIIKSILGDTRRFYNIILCVHIKLCYKISWCHRECF